jgi:hypothetical protein
LLEEEKITLAGTLRRNRRENPASFICARGKVVFSIMPASDRDERVVSYVPRQVKVVLLLSTIGHCIRID